MVEDIRIGDLILQPDNSTRSVIKIISQVIETSASRSPLFAKHRLFGNSDKSVVVTANHKIKCGEKGEKLPVVYNSIDTALMFPKECPELMRDVSDEMKYPITVYNIRTFLSFIFLYITYYRT